MARTNSLSDARPITTTKQSHPSFGPGLLLALLALLFIGTYPEIFFKGHVFVYRDAGIFNYPTHYFAAESWRAGEVPLWNPWNNCGIPFLAQWNVMALYPLSAIFVWFAPPQSITYFSILHFFIAGLGMFYLARRWTNNSFAGAVAGLAFAWNGLTLHALMWPNSCASFGWAPWVLFFVDKAIKEGGRNVIYAALVGAMQMLAGVPEIVLITWLVCGALFVMECLRTPAQRLGLSLRFFGAGLLVAGLTAAQMLPFFDLLLHSQRNTSYSDVDTWAMPLWGWANFFVPVFRTTTSFQGVHLQSEQQWSSSYYLGVGIIVLAVLAVLRNRQPKVWLMTGIAIAGCILALGKAAGVYGLVKTVLPIIGFMRYPAKWVQLAWFALPLLAAFGIASFADDTSNAKCRKNLWAIIGVTVAIIGIVIVCAFAFQRPDEPARHSLQNGVVRIVFLGLIGGAIVQFFRASEGMTKTLCGIAVLVLLGVDVSTHVPRQHPTVPATAYAPVDLQMKEKPELGLGRAMIDPHLQNTMRRAGSTNILEDYRVKRLVLYGNANILDHVPKVNGMYSLYIKEQAEIEKKLFDPENFPEALAAFASVSALCVQPKADIFSWRWIPQQTLPMLTLGQKAVFADDSETLASISSDRYNPTQIVYLPREAEGVVQATNVVTDANILADEKYNIAPPKIGSRELIFTIGTPKTAMVVVSQTFYHSWKAYVDGKPTRIWRANYGFQAIEVASGQHQIRFVYEDDVFNKGVIVSVASLIACLIGWVMLRRTRPVPVE